MKMLKIMLAGYVLALCTVLLLVAYLGGDAITQGGIRLSAIEQGFSLAGRHWSYDAFPAHEQPMQVAVVEKAPAVKPVKKGKK
jgi:hypothetical protein